MTKQPNILFFFTDMQRADTICALGNSIIKTPSLDRLVREGTAFTNCFSPSPVCVPARCSMHYGLYPQKTGLFVNGRMMDDNGNSYPEILGRAGYRTAAIGKCHFTPDKLALRGFNTRLVQEECTSNPESDDYVRFLKDNDYDYYEPHGARGEMYYIPQISTLSAEAHPTHWIGDRSIDFIKQASDSKQPWCLFSSFIHPHPPFAPPKPWHKLYRSPQMPPPAVPENPQSLYTWINRHQNRYKYRDQGIDNNLMRNIKAHYYATISFIDFQVGRVLEQLEESGQLDNTLIMFSSDHGEYLGDFHCFGKRSMHDASSRVPMIVRYPERFQPGHICEEPVSLVDVLPTFTEAAGIDIGDMDIDGVDLASIADGEIKREYVYSQFGEAERGIYMIVSKNWKYFYSAADRTEFMFDRYKDPTDSCNVADSPDVNDIKTTLKQQLLSYLKEQGAEDAYIDSDTGLDWRQHPPIDEEYLQDPDANLLIQDYPSYELNLPGYS